MLGFGAAFFCLGLTIASLIAMVPDLRRLVREQPELLVTLWPTSVGLMAADALGWPAVVVAAVENGLLYGLLGVSLWLLVGTERASLISGIFTVGPRSDARVLRQRCRRVLGLLSLALCSLALLAQYFGSITARLAVLAATIAGMILAGHRDVFPFSHLSQSAHPLSPTLSTLRASLRHARDRILLPMSTAWLSCQVVVASIGWGRGWNATTWEINVSAILWTTAIACISLGATSAILWLSFHVLSAQRLRNV